MPRIPERGDSQHSDCAVHRVTGIPDELPKQDAACRKCCQQERAIPTAVFRSEKHGRQGKDEKRHGQRHQVPN